MSDGIKNTANTINLSAEELDAALRLLLVEKQTKSKRLPERWLNLILVLIMPFAIFLCPVSLILARDGNSISILLFLASLVLFLISGMLGGGTFDFDRKTKSIRKSLKGTELGETAEAKWKKKENFQSIAGLISVFGFTVACGWVIYSWQFLGSINHTSLIVLAATVAIGMLLAVISSYREYQYFWIVSQLQDQFEVRLQKLKTEKLNRISVPAEEVKLLGKLETAQLNHKIKETADRIANTLKDFYSITITPEVLKFLNSLSDNQQKDKYVIRDFIDSLQMNPYPKNIKLSESIHDFVGHVQNYEVVYRVNAKKRNIEVIRIR